MLGGWGGDLGEGGREGCDLRSMWFDGEVLESEGYGAENGNDLPLGEVITHANRGSRVCALAHYEQHEVVHPPSVHRGRRLSQPGSTIPLLNTEVSPCDLVC
ncbi:hypothetical protein BN381_80038 [Candidatus Microthrix parvicella RN1]|jgi:hypothetical protein|uniref:Uncharacterized protein n=1 Tax=Candidatus Neomicrothrix parvicella RN1 TaxID=1229780 RepID=R4Z448_9ACTN|nr:hypothetical protein BN381_80038 [Candidatus Microthrix parvicella RN1]